MAHRRSIGWVSAGQRRPGGRRPGRGGRVVLVLGLLALPALAGGDDPQKRLASATAEAQKAAKKGEWGQAVGRLEEALALARDRAPLEVRQAVVTTRPHAGLGMYEPAREGRVEGREVDLYLEVANHGHRPHPDGTFEIFLEVSAAFTYDDGTEKLELGERALGAHRVYPRTVDGVTSLGVPLALSEKAPAGRYELLLKVKDRISGKEGQGRVEFILR